MEVPPKQKQQQEQVLVRKKKLWNIVRIVFFMLRKGISKSKLKVEFPLLLKRSKKAISNSFHHRNHHDDNDVVLSDYRHHHPRDDYEFSCSNSPASSFFPFHLIKRNKHHNCHAPRFPRASSQSQFDDAYVDVDVQKVLEMLNNGVNGSPLVGFGKKQVRITDSPFPLKEELGDSQVDVAAEEFIKRFYRDLNSQRKLADSPYPYSWER